APRSARLRRRPRRHEDAASPGSVSRGGHLRPAVPGGERSRTAGAARRGAPERPLSRRRARGGCRVSAPAFELPPRVEAPEPPEARGLRRDGVRLLVANRSSGLVVHSRFDELPSFLDPGDLVVVNTSATLPAALPAQRRDGQALELRLSTPSPDEVPNRWVVEVRLGEGSFAGAAA